MTTIAEFKRVLIEAIERRKTQEELMQLIGSTSSYLSNNMLEDGMKSVTSVKSDKDAQQKL